MILSNVSQPVADAVYEVIKEKIAAGVPLCSRVASMSMAPLILTGDRVAIHYCRINDLRSNNIIALRAGNDIIVHRFVCWEENNGERRLLTKSDWTLSYDPPTPADNFLGIVRSIERDGKTLVLHSPRGRAVEFLCRKRAQLGLLAGRVKHLLRRVVLRTKDLTGFHCVYRCYYFGVIHLVRFLLTGFYQAEAVWLRRSFATGDWEPGRSDLDFGVRFTCAAPVDEPRTIVRISRAMRIVKKFTWIIGEVDLYTAEDLAIECRFASKGREALNWKFVHGATRHPRTYELHPLKYKLDATVEMLIVLVMFGRSASMRARPKQPDVYLSERFSKALWDLLRWSAALETDFGYGNSIPLGRNNLKKFLATLPSDHFLREAAVSLDAKRGIRDEEVGTLYAEIINHLSTSLKALSKTLETMHLENRVWPNSPRHKVSVGRTTCCIRPQLFTELDFYELEEPLDPKFLLEFLANQHVSAKTPVIGTSALSSALTLCLPDNIAAYFVDSRSDVLLARLLLMQQATLQLRALSRIAAAGSRRRQSVSEALLASTAIDSLKLLLAAEEGKYFSSGTALFEACYAWAPEMRSEMQRLAQISQAQDAALVPACRQTQQWWLKMIYPRLVSRLRGLCSEKV